jgi:hypothetical protein
LSAISAIMVAMESGTEPVEALIAHLIDANQPAWGRWAIERVEQGWHLRYAEIMVGAYPPGYASRRWTYANYLFIEQRTTAHQLAAALRGRSVRMGKLHLRSAPLHTTAMRGRRQSFADFDGHRLPWPTTRYEVSTEQPTSASSGNDPLISLTSPSFAYQEAAFSAFFRPHGPSRWQLNSGVVVTVADVDARITGLAIRPGEIIVDVAGEHLAGCSVQLSSGGWSQTVPAEVVGPLTFPLPDPFSRELLVVLADERWRDLRLINPPGMPNAADPSIVWDDPRLQLEAILAGGEGATVEFKSKLPTKATESIRTALKAVPAFANGAGGVLIFGVNDDGGVVGLAEEASDVTSRLTDLVHGNVHPIPPFRLEPRELDGKLVVLLEVDPGAAKPFALFRDPPRFYARHGATSFHATREEIVALSGVNQFPGRYA